MCWIFDVLYVDLFQLRTKEEMGVSSEERKMRKGTKMDCRR